MIPSTVRRLCLPRLGSSSFASSSSSTTFLHPPSSFASSSTGPQHRHLSCARPTARQEVNDDDVFVKDANGRTPPSFVTGIRKPELQSTVEDSRSGVPNKPRFVDPDNHNRGRVHPRARQKKFEAEIRHGTFGLDAPIDGSLAALTPYIAPTNLPAARSTHEHRPLPIDLPTLNWFASFNDISWRRHISALPNTTTRRDHVSKAILLRKALRRGNPRAQAEFLATQQARLDTPPEIIAIKQQVCREVPCRSIAFKLRPGPDRLYKEGQFASLPKEEREKLKERYKREMIEDAEEGEPREKLRARFEALEVALKERKRRMDERIKLWEQAQREQGGGGEQRRIGGDE